MSHIPVPFLMRMRILTRKRWAFYGIVQQVAEICAAQLGKRAHLPTRVLCAGKTVNFNLVHAFCHFQALAGDIHKPHPYLPRPLLAVL